MKTAVIALLLILSLATNALLWQRVSRLEAATTSATPADFPLGENMGYLQRCADKIWFAAQAGNWPLARYYHDEMAETADDVIHAKLIKEGAPVSANMSAMLPPALVGIDQAIAARDLPSFRSHYTGLIQACNACHAASRHSFIHIAEPTHTSDFWNQQFSPQP
ncbi:hypothetical protein K0B96_13150 [Horticoccus luteus]|uniref:Cytochrome c domain-containing protein n=1 Tax=Horticoccus luteus TaxID=2862869 RepID=A0A8F9TUY0_9BACT|nr:hypothetical protein [Horticoccus luteus]QYM78243.1 hypothetical protein K0B96_13150 [Horticoccus luteus]